LRTALDEPLPANALAKIKRLLARLELVLTQIAELERERDTVVETEASDKASKMIRQLTVLRGIGALAIRGNVAVVRHGATAPSIQSSPVPECGTVVGINSRRREYCKNVRKFLPGRRPHVTQSCHSRVLSWTRFVAWKIICAVVISGVIMDHGGWLRSLGLELYEAAFRQNAIDHTVLPRFDGSG